MKTKLVFWGTNEKDEKILIAMNLRPEDNMVDVFVFPETVSTETFANLLHDEWRNGKEVPFPEGFVQTESELSITQSPLPEGIKVDRADILQRAQTEWQFVVLSAKLNNVYQSELSDLKEKIDGLTSFDSKTWENLKSFWSKVQEQVRDRNLFREHANDLRDNTNALFTKLKDLRSSLDEEFQSKSKEYYDQFNEKLQEVEDRIKADSKLQAIFEDLKSLQRTFRDTKLTRDHRSKIWERLDGMFKQVKEKRFGPNAGDSSPLERLQRRYNGLMTAIEKMEKSIQRDHDDLKFQNRKIEQSEGQLEAQIRQAKIKMIEERIRSKENKLGEMNATRAELEKRMASQKQKDLKLAEKEKLEQAKKDAAQKIKASIKEAEAARIEENDKLEKAAEAIVKKEEPKEAAEETLLEAITSTLGESLEDVVDTARAVAEVIGHKIGDAVAEVKEKVEEVKETVQEEVQQVSETVAADDLKKIEGIGPKIEELLQANEIKSFQQLANTSADQINQILATAGGSYNRHDPTTWPKQAAMAASGDWAALKTWQDELDGGRIVTDASEEE